MKKTVYIVPATNIVKLQTKDGLLQAVSANLSTSFSSAHDGEDGVYADVKEDRGGWGDEW